MSERNNNPATDAHEPTDPDFRQRRDAARKRLDALIGADSSDAGERKSWFEAVYESADGDPAGVPWADLTPKPKLLGYLADNPGKGRTALDVACGLGDNAEAIAGAGYQTTAFDLAEGAIRWAIERFPNTQVNYQTADLFFLPAEWNQAYDFVHEYYTVQALEGEMRTAAPAAIARLVAPAGRLLVVARARAEGTVSSGPPWPLMPSEVDMFAQGTGLTEVSREVFEVQKQDLSVPHVKAIFARPPL